MQRPYLQFFLLARDAIRDARTGEYSAIRIFDTIKIPKDQDRFVHTFSIFGRLFLEDVGVANLKSLIKIYDPQEKEIHSLELNGKINTSIGINIDAYSGPVTFEIPGEHRIEFHCGVNDAELKKIDSPAYFTVEKLI